MKNLTHSFRQNLYNRLANYLAYGDITLTDGTFIQVTNSEIWAGGFSYEEGVSNDNSFDAVGSAVIGSAELIINNISETYSQYDFTNAKVVLYLGMQLEEPTGTRLEKFKVGTYKVDDTSYNGAIIKLSLLDYMEQFDRPYTASTLLYPATLDQIVRDACTKCGVMLNTYNFPHKEFVVDSVPDKDTLTFRDVISQCAAIAGCFAKMNVDGQLELKWFNTTELDTALDDVDGGTFNPWSTGTEYNGGTFNPWTEGEDIDGGSLHDSRSVNYISSIFSQNICVDDVVITGVTIVVEDKNSSEADNKEVYSVGTNDYVVLIENNSFITKTNAQTILDWLGTQLIGLRFRKLDLTCTSDPAIEAGDVGIVIDRKQNVYRILVTRVGFSINGAETVVCGASTPSRNSATKFSSISKTYAALRKQLNHEKSLREQMEEQLAEDIANSNGLYYTEEVDEQTGATKYYLHSKPNLDESSIRILVSDVGITVTNDGGEHWYGLTVNGNLIANILSATGITADWIHGGTLTLGGENNINGQLTVYDANGNAIGRWDNSGILVNSGTIQLTFTSGQYVSTTTVGSSGIFNEYNGETAGLSSGQLTLSGHGRVAYCNTDGFYITQTQGNSSFSIGDEVSLDNNWYIEARGKKLSITAPGIDIHSSSFLDIDGASPTITNSSDSTTPSKLTLSSSATLNGHSGISLNVNGFSSMYLTESDIYAYAGGARILDAGRRGTTIYSSNTVSSTVYTNAYFSYPEIDFYCNGSRVMSLDYKGLDYLKNGYYGSINCGNVTLNVYYGIITGYSVNSTGGGGTTPPEEDPDIVINDP